MITVKMDDLGMNMDDRYAAVVFDHKDYTLNVEGLFTTEELQALDAYGNLVFHSAQAWNSKHAVLD